jgi:hypothetical protein
MRFNISNIDTSFVEKGISYEKIPDVYAIFISQFDVFAENCTSYHIDRAIRETGTIVENGIHEIYINTAIDDGTLISKLMQFFQHSVGNNPLFPKLSHRIEYFKEVQEGVLNMSNVFEEYAEEKVKEATAEVETSAAMKLLKKGIPVETILEALPSLSMDFIKQLKQQLPQS